MSNDSTRQHLLGTWKLITAVREEIASGTKPSFWRSQSGVPRWRRKPAADQQLAETRTGTARSLVFVSDERPREGPLVRSAGREAVPPRPGFSSRAVARHLAGGDPCD